MLFRGLAINSPTPNEQYFAQSVGSRLPFRKRQLPLGGDVIEAAANPSSGKASTRATLGSVAGVDTAAAGHIGAAVRRGALPNAGIPNPLGSRDRMLRRR